MLQNALTLSAKALENLCGPAAMDIRHLMYSSTRATQEAWLQFSLLSFFQSL